MNKRPNHPSRTRLHSELDASRAAHDARVARFSGSTPSTSERSATDAWGDPGPTPRDIRERKAKESKSTLGFMKAAGFMGVAAIVALTLTKGNDSGEKPPAYSGFDKKEYVIPHGGGALDAVRAVDPLIADDAWKSPQNEQKLENLEHFINGQAPGGQNGSLQEGQTVRVPVIPGEQTPPKTQ